MKVKQIFFCLLFLGVVAFVTSCNDDSDQFEREQQEDNSGNADNIEDNVDTDVDLPSNTDDELILNTQDLSTLSNAVFVVFDENEDATVSELNNISSVISGNHVTITSTADAGVNYILAGITENGSVTFTSNNKFNLYLNGVGIINPSGAAIKSTQKAVSVVIQDNTQNRLIDSETSGEKAAFYSKGKMDFSGNGILEVRGKAKHAISSGNEITINSGTIYIKEAASDAIHGDGITIIGGTITAYATGEGMDADDVGSIDISGGTITIVTTGQKGHGIKTSSDTSTGEKGNIHITGGTFDITTTGIASKTINSDGNVTISGGNLVLKATGNAYYDSDERDTSSAAGIKCEGDLLIENNPDITIKTTGSGGKGINVTGAIIQNGGTLKVITTGSKYTYSSNYTSSAKGITADGNVTINDGTCSVSSAYHEGIESVTNITINGGTVESIAYDDGLNVSSSNGSIVINGGYVYVYGANNTIAGNSGGNSMTKPGDGIDSNGSITITGGVVIVAGGGSPDEAFDCEGNFYVNGGTIIGVGGQHSCLPSTSGKQNSIAYGGASVSSGDYIQLKNSSGESLLVYKIPRSISDVKMILSHANLANGSYTLVKGGTYSGGTEIFHGYYTGGSYSGGTNTSITISSALTKVGSISSTGGSGNNGGRW